MTTKIGLFIFRRDLRLTDNLALNMLTKEVDIIIPIFILDPAQIIKNEKNKHHYNNNCIQFICECLIDLNEQLNEHHKNHLFLFMGNACDIVKKIINKINISHVAFNLDFSPYAIQRDESIMHLCKEKQIICLTNENDFSLLETKNLLNNNNPYKVFTPFYKNAHKHIVNKAEHMSKSTKFVSNLPQSIKNSLYNINKLKLLYVENNNLAQKGGRSNGLERLKQLKNQKYYSAKRDQLSYQTSMLSGYLSLGCISVRETYYEMKKILGRTDLIKQLYWRDFFLIFYRFVNDAKSYKSYVDDRFNKIKWRSSNEFKEEFEKAWYGQSGLLCIDAAMNQLRTTGYMAGRARMFTHIYFTKYLLIDIQDPKYGAHYWFSRNLLDCAGTSQNKMNGHFMVDIDYPARRFASKGGISGRKMTVSNDYLIKKFDTDAIYIKTYLPHLKDVPVKDLRKWNKETAKKYGNIHPYFEGDLDKMYDRWINKTHSL